MRPGLLSATNALANTNFRCWKMAVGIKHSGPIGSNHEGWFHQPNANKAAPQTTTKHQRAYKIHAMKCRTQEASVGQLLFGRTSGSEPVHTTVGLFRPALGKQRMHSDLLEALNKCRQLHRVGNALDSCKANRLSM